MYFLKLCRKCTTLMACHIIKNRFFIFNTSQRIKTPIIHLLRNVYLLQANNLINKWMLAPIINKQFFNILNEETINYLYIYIKSTIKHLKDICEWILFNIKVIDHIYYYELSLQKVFNYKLHFDNSQLYWHEHKCVFIFLDKKAHNYICFFGLLDQIAVKNICLFDFRDQKPFITKLHFYHSQLFQPKSQ